MKRGFLAGGAAILVAAALAVPLWLAVDDDGGRRTGAIGAGQGYSAELAIDGVAGSPFPVESFSWEAKAVGGTAKPVVSLNDLEIVRGADSRSGSWFGFAAGAKAAPATLVVKRPDPTTGTAQTFLTYRLTDAVVRAYDSSEDDTTPAGATDPPFDTIGLRYSAIEHVLGKSGVIAAPGGTYLRMNVSTASTQFVELLGYQFGFSRPVDEASGLPTGRSSVDRLLVTRRLDDGLARWFAERATTGGTPPGTTVTIELRRAVQTTGQVETYVTYELKNAVVASVRDSGGRSVVPLQTVGFTFDTLQATSADGSGCIAATETC